MIERALERALERPLEGTVERQASYTGPLDLVPGAVWAVSLRAMTADSGAEAVRIQRSSDNTQQTFSCVSNNSVDVSAIDTFIGGGNDGYIKTLFDQAGNIDQTIADPAGVSLWISDLNGSKSGMTLSSGAPLQSVGNVSLANGQATLFVVAKASSTNIFLSSGAGAYADFWLDASAYMDLFDGTNEAGGSYGGLVDAGTFYLFVITVEFGNNSFTYNGTTAPENNDNDDGGALGAITKPMIIYSDGGIQEAILYDTILSAPNIALVTSNMAAYYSLP